MEKWKKNNSTSEVASIEGGAYEKDLHYLSFNYFDNTRSFV